MKLTIRYLLIIACAGYLMAWSKAPVIPNSTGHYNLKGHSLEMAIFKTMLSGLIDEKKYAVFSDPKFDISYKHGDTTFHFNTLTHQTYFRFWNHVVIGGPSFNYNGNGAIGVSSGDTIEINSNLGAITSYSALLNISNVYVMPLNGIVVFNATLDVSGWAGVKMIGSVIGGSGYTPTYDAGSMVYGKSFGYWFSVTTGSQGCILFGGTMTDDKFQYILCEGSTKPFFDMNANITTWNGNSNTKMLLRDTIEYDWSRNSASWTYNGGDVHKNMMDSCQIDHLEEDSNTVINAWVLSPYHTVFDHIRRTAKNTSLLDDAIDNGWMIVNGGQGCTWSNIFILGPHWGYGIGRFFIGGYDFAALNIYNILCDFTLTYGFLDMRGQDSASMTTAIGIPGLQWHTGAWCYIDHITNGNNSNARTPTVGGYITNFIFYGLWNPNGHIYAYGFFQFHHTQYGGIADSVSITDFSGQTGVLVWGYMVYQANPLSPAAITDTTANWYAKAGGVLTSMVINYPINRGTDIYGHSDPNLIGAAAPVTLPGPCNCSILPIDGHTFNNKKQIHENSDVTLSSNNNYDWRLLPTNTENAGSKGLNRVQVPGQHHYGISEDEGRLGIAGIRVKRHSRKGAGDSDLL